MAKSYKVKKSSSKKGGSRRKRNYKGGSPGCGSCSSSNLIKGGSRRKRGGKGDFNSSILAYTGKPQPQGASNPYLAYTGSKSGINLASAYPNPGQNNNFMSWLNTQQTGGKYPNGLTGEPWTASAQTWPGVNGVDSDNNHYQLNNYNNDVSRQMVDVGAAAPYVIGGRRRGRKGGRRTRSRKGGVGLGNNSLLQDAANIGRQVNTGLGGVYNALNGYRPPVSPLPWKDQLVNSNSNNLNYLKYNNK